MLSHIPSSDYFDSSEYVLGQGVGESVYARDSYTSSTAALQVI